MMASVDNNTDTAEIIRSGNDLSTTNIESEDEILSVDPFSTDEAVEAFANFKNHNSGSQSNESEILDESEESGEEQEEFDVYKEKKAS